MKVQSASGMAWLSNLPTALASVFTDRSMAERPAPSAEVYETQAVHKPRWEERNDEALAGVPERRRERRPEIMVPVDFSPEAMEAADYAIDVAQRARARLVLLHAVHLNLTPYGPANPVWLRAGLCREALEKMEATMSKAQRVGVPVISVIEEGAPAKVISEAARRWKIDLLVLASQRRSKLGRFFGDHIKEKVARGVKCPVIVINPAAQAEAAV